MLVQSECSQKSLGKVSNAGVSLNKHRRKPEVERPLSSFKRRTWSGQVVILEGTQEGWKAITPQGVFINPWKNRPFSTLKSCCNAVEYRLKKGHWPTKIRHRKPEAGRL
jgi:hypothetical protein